jgi:hypothetical protein
VKCTRDHEHASAAVARACDKVFDNRYFLERARATVAALEKIDKELTAKLAELQK